MEQDRITIISAITEKHILEKENLMGKKTGMFTVTYPDELVGVVVVPDQTSDQATALKENRQEVIVYPQ